MSRRHTAIRRLGIPAALVTAALALAACSGGGGTPAPSSIKGVDLSGQTLEISADWSGSEQKDFEKVLDGFEQATGAKVNYTSLGNNIATVLGTKVEGGNPPNIAVIPQPGLLKQLAQEGALKPLSSDVLSTVKENYSQDWIDLGSVDGTPYGVWFKGSNKSTVWYNADIYDEAGATVPKTWDDFLKQLQLVSDAGYAGISIGADVGWPLTDWFENVYLRTAGPEMYDKLSNHEIPWTDPSVTTALQTLGQLWGNSTLVEPGSAQRTFPETVTEVFGDDPKAGTVFEGDFLATNISQDTSAKVGETAKFYDFPSINGSGPTVVGGGNAAVAFKDDKATMALMKYLASPEAGEIWVKLGGFTSPNKNVDLSSYPDDTSRQIAQALVGAQTFRFDMSDLAPAAFGGTEGSGEWQVMIEFLNNPTDVEGTQQKLEQAAAAAWK